MARTTLDLDPSVLGELRRRSASERRSMGTVASELLASALVQSDPEPSRLEWVARDLGIPRVDIEDQDALRAILDDPR